MNVKEVVRQLGIPRTGYLNEDTLYIVLTKLANPDPIDENLYRLIVGFKYKDKTHRTRIYHLRWDETSQTWSFDQSMTNKKLEKEIYQKSPWEHIDIE